MTIAKEVVDAHKEAGNAIISLNKDVKSTLGIGKAILSGNYGKTSIVRLTKDQIMQFPIIMSMDIDNDEKRPIIKAIERNYATLVLMGILNTGRVDWDKYESINDFLKEFHNNYDVKISTEAFDVLDAVVNDGYMDKNTAMELWESVEDQLDTDLINDMYLPFNRTSAKLEKALETNIDEIKLRYQVKDLTNKLSDLTDRFNNLDGSAKRARADRDEARKKFDDMKKDFDKKVQQAAKKMSDDDIRTTIANKQITATHNENVDERTFRDKQRQESEKHSKELAALNDKYKKEQQLQAHQLRMSEKANTGEMVQEDKFSAMMPSILRLEITATKTGVGDWRQGLYVGIKAMPRYIKSSLLVSNMVEALQNRTIFKFIKWTKEEEKWYDLLFDVAASKDESLGKNKWLKALARRSKTNKFRRYITGQGWNPNVTIIITEAEAHEIQSICGLSLFDPNNVRRIIDKYFLLGFGIYDTEGKMLKMMYDSEDYYTSYSLRHLMLEAKRDLNLLSLFKY